MASNGGPAVPGPALGGVVDAHACGNSQCVRRKGIFTAEINRLSLHIQQLETDNASKTTENRRLKAERDKLQDKLANRGKHTERVCLGYS
jgi:hypothetical protein